MGAKPQNVRDRLVLDQCILPFGPDIVGRDGFRTNYHNHAVGAMNRVADLLEEAQGPAGAASSNARDTAPNPFADSVTQS